MGEGAGPKLTLPYGRQLVDDEDIQAVIEVLRGDFLTQGPFVQRFEEELARVCGARHAVAVTNGTVALELACRAAGVGPGDDGITTPITFAASANCIATSGGRPRFVDIERGTWNLDASLLTAAIGARTKVVVPVHFAGLPCDMAAIREACDRRGVTVIADACHALGATLDGQPIGHRALAHMTCLSFHPVKHITTAEGGAVVTDDDALARRLRILRNHGMVAEPEAVAAHGGWFREMHFLATNGRLSDVHSALGLSQLAKLPRFISRRQEIARRYRAGLARLAGVATQGEPTGRVNAHHLFVIWLDPARHDRRRVYEALHKSGILVQVHYVPVHLHPYYRATHQTRPGQFPVAEEYYAGALSLPMYPGLRDEDVDRVIGELVRILDTP